MPSLPNLLGVHGQPPLPVATSFRGRTLTPRLFTQPLKAAFVDWLKRRALRDLHLERDLLSPEEFTSRRRQLQAEFDAGDYDYYGDVSIAAQKTRGGVIKLLSLVYDIDEDEALFVMAGCPEAVEGFNRALADSFPAAAATGSPSDPSPAPPPDERQAPAKNP